MNTTMIKKLTTEALEAKVRSEAIYDKYSCMKKAALTEIGLDDGDTYEIDGVATFISTCRTDHDVNVDRIEDLIQNGTVTVGQLLRCIKKFDINMLETVTAQDPNIIREKQSYITTLRADRSFIKDLKENLND